MRTSLGVAINYTPLGSELDLTLAVVRDDALLVTVLKSAIAEADQHARTESDLVAANGYRTQRDFLQKCLEQTVDRLSTTMTRQLAPMMMRSAALTAPTSQQVM